MESCEGFRNVLEVEAEAVEVVLNERLSWATTREPQVRVLLRPKPRKIEDFEADFEVMEAFLAASEATSFVLWLRCK